MIQLRKSKFWFLIFGVIIKLGQLDVESRLLGGSRQLKTFYNSPFLISGTHFYTIRIIKIVFMTQNHKSLGIFLFAFSVITTITFLLFSEKEPMYDDYDRLMWWMVNGEWSI